MLQGNLRANNIYAFNSVCYFGLEWMKCLGVKKSRQK
jgi:hypothetical protein